MTPNPAPSPWSPQWRSLHPVCTDEKILDALRPYLQEKFSAHFGPRLITSLHLVKQGSPCFRLPDGRFCHWAQTTKTASLSIEAAICAHMPSLWAGAHKYYPLPANKQAAAPLMIFVEQPAFPDILPVPAAAPFLGVPRRAYRLRLSPDATDPRWATILCNVEDPACKPPTLHALRIEPFRPRVHAQIRFCVLRDPVERFLSSFRYLRSADIFLNPERLPASLPQFLALSEDYLRKGAAKMQPQDEERLRLHIVPQSHFIGSEPSYYTHIFRMGEWQRLKHFLSDWLSASVQLPHLNKSQSESDAGLTPEQKQRIEALYAEDYAAWGKYF